MIKYNRVRTAAKLIAVFVLLLAISFSLYGCFGKPDTGSEESGAEDGTISKGKDINSVVLRDSETVYMYDDEGSVVTMYLTVRRGNSAENTNHSWADVNSYSIFDYLTLGADRYAVEAILKIGDENGPVMGEFGFGVNIPNAIVNVRGNTTSRAAQKSFKIEIKREKGSWRQQRTIALNKHPYDETRILNKLCYDLMKDIPDMISARTQFVHLYVKDETGEDAANAEYVDYGLFTQVEQMNRTYLENHGLDRNGHMYKIEYFEFFRYEDAIRLKTDPDYDIAKFEEVLEIKGNDDHAKLIKMLEDLNNYTMDIEDIFPKYFSEENYFTWMAFHILTGNIDTINRNFFLYSPLNSEKWYFISWDNDGSFSRTSAMYKGIYRDYGHEIGMSNYWGCVLHRRVLSKAAYREKLDKKIEEMRVYLSRERITGLIETYKPVVKSLIYSMPDVMYNYTTEERYDGLLDVLPDEIELNYELYKESLLRPMPFYIDRPSYEGDRIKYTWGIAFDFRGEDILYSVEIARDLAFTEMIAAYDNIRIPIVYTDDLETGQYFIRVKAVNESGYEQKAQDYYISENGKNYGVYVFYIQPNGKIDS